MRPTLLRVLTDLYVQKLTHTPDEERHYTELALRLLEAVDVPTRADTAARLSRHLSPPARVIEFLAADLPSVAAALRSLPIGQPSSAAAETVPIPALTPIAEDAASDHTGERESEQKKFESDARTDATVSIGADVASELNELFFAANANERRLILLNLDVVATLPPEPAGVSHDAAVGKRLETAALGRNHEDFAQHLARSLRISRGQARRIASDELGEPIVVAAKALRIPRDVLYRILLFVNTAVGHSVERVHALAELYDELTAQAAQDMVAIWQALARDERPSPRHQPALWTDEARSPARPGVATVHRAPAVFGRGARRDAS